MISDVLDSSQKFQCISFACLIIALFILVQCLLLNLHYLHIALLHFYYNSELHALLHCITDSTQLPACGCSQSGAHTHCGSRLMKQ